MSPEQQEDEQQDSNPSNDHAATRLLKNMRQWAYLAARWRVAEGIKKEREEDATFGSKGRNLSPS